MSSRWSLLVIFPPVIEQGWEEQNEGEDFAAWVINTVKDLWEFDDEVSNDYRGEGFEDNVLWLLSEDRTELRLFAEVLDQLDSAITAVLSYTIPLRMVLTKEE